MNEMNQKNVCSQRQVLPQIIIILIKKIPGALHLISGLKALHSSTRLFGITTAARKTKHVRAPSISTVDNHNDSGGRERQNDNESIQYSGCDVRGKGIGHFCDSVVHGKETRFVGLFE